MLKEELAWFEQAIDKSLGTRLAKDDIEESGTVVSLDMGIAKIRGLRAVKNQELVEFSGKVMGMVYDLNPNDVGVILLGGF